MKPLYIKSSSDRYSTRAIMCLLVQDSIEPLPLSELLLKWPTMAKQLCNILDLDCWVDENEARITLCFKDPERDPPYVH